MSKTFLLYPTILQGQEAETWKANSRTVLIDFRKRAIIDGIDPTKRGGWTFSNWPKIDKEVLKTFWNL